MLNSSLSFSFSLSFFSFYFALLSSLSFLSLYSLVRHRRRDNQRVFPPTKRSAFFFSNNRKSVTLMGAINVVYHKKKTSLVKKRKSSMKNSERLEATPIDANRHSVFICTRCYKPLRSRVPSDIDIIKYWVRRTFFAFSRHFYFLTSKIQLAIDIVSSIAIYDLSPTLL